MGGAAWNVTHDKSDGTFNGTAGRIARLGDALKAQNAELTPAGREVRIGDLGDAEQRHTSSIDSAGWGRIRGSLPQLSVVSCQLSVVGALRAGQYWRAVAGRWCGFRSVLARRVRGCARSTPSCC